MNQPADTDEYFPLARNINAYYFFHLFNNLSFWLPVYAIFFLRQGIDYSLLLILYGVNNIVQTTLEIPSGVLADRIGRRPVLMLGALFQASGFFMIALGGTLVWYMAGMALHGAALAMTSGADTAFIYDSLIAAGQEERFKMIEGRAYMYNLIGWGVAGLLGGLVATYSLALPFGLTAGAAILGLFVIGTTQEPPRYCREGEKQVSGTRELISQSIQIFRSKAPVRNIIIFASVVIGILLAVHKFSQPYLESASIKLEYFGIIYFFWLMFAALSARFSEKIEKLMGPSAYFISLPMASAIAILYMWYWQNPFGVVMALLYQFAWGSLRPQMFQIINSGVSSGLRATMLSLIGFGSSAIYIIMVPLAGYLADKHSFPLALLALGLAMLIFGLITARLLLRSRPEFEGIEDKIMSTGHSLPME